jgi:hypothetical protein
MITRSAAAGFREDTTQLKPALRRLLPRLWPLKSKGHGLSMVVSSVSLVSTTKIARSLAGSVVLAFSLIR